MPRRTSDLATTEKEEYFCRQYMLLKNGSAAWRATFPERRHLDSLTISRYAVKLRNKPAVRARIDQLRDEARKKYAVQLDEVIGELAHIAFTSIGDLIQQDEKGNVLLAVDPDHGPAMAPVKKLVMNDDGSIKEIQLHDKLAALDKLGRHLGLYDREQGDPTDPNDGEMRRWSNTELAQRLLYVLNRAIIERSERPLINVTPEEPNG